MRDDPDVRVVERGANDEAGAERMELIAKLAAKLLCETYPNHVWVVGWAPGAVLVIKNLAMDGRYGYTVDAAGADSVTHLEKLIVRAGGELLERMGLPRDRPWDGTIPERVDGVTPR
jgi:hypothetical protein